MAHSTRAKRTRADATLRHGDASRRQAADAGATSAPADAPTLGAAQADALATTTDTRDEPPDDLPLPSNDGDAIQAQRDATREDAWLDDATVDEDDPTADDSSAKASADDAGDDPDEYVAEVGEPDYYAALGMTPTATHAELRQAYRRLAKLWHPDRYVDAPPRLRAQAERRIRALTRAYAVLGDAIQRRLYDRRRADVEAPTNGAARNSPYDQANGVGYRAPDYTGYTAWSGARQGGQPEQASENANGAGVFFGALALVVGLGLFVGASQSGSGWVFALGAVILVALVVLAVIFSQQESPLARAAQGFMEGEPTGYADPYAGPGWRGARYADRPASRRRPAGGATRHKAAPGGARRQSANPTDGDPAPGDEQPTNPQRPTTAGVADDARPYDEAPATTDADALDLTDADTAAFARFQQYVVAAVEALPAEFRAQMGAMVVRVADEPDAATLRKMSVGRGHTLFGMYEGVPLTKQGSLAPPPEVVTIYRGPITRACQGDPARIREQTRRTVLHEVAHHFGIDHDEMPEWVK